MEEIFCKVTLNQVMQEGKDAVADLNDLCNSNTSIDINCMVNGLQTVSELCSSILSFLKNPFSLVGFSFISILVTD